MDVLLRLRLVILSSQTIIWGLMAGLDTPDKQDAINNKKEASPFHHPISGSRGKNVLDWSLESIFSLHLVFKLLFSKAIHLPIQFRRL